MTTSSKRTPDSVLLFFRLVRPYRSRFLIAMIALAGGSGINLLFPEIIRRLLNGDYQQYLIENPFPTAVALIGLFAIQGLFFYVRSYLFNVIGQKAVYDLRVRLYKAVIHRSVAFFDSVRTGDLVSRIASDAQLIQDAVSIRLSVLIRYSFQVVVGLILMSALSLQLTVAIVLTLPVLVVISIFLGKRLRHFSKEVQRTLGDATTVAEETFSGVKIVKVFGKEQSETERFTRAAAAVLDFAIERSRVSAFFSSFVSFLMNAAIVGILMLGISFVHTSDLTYGDLTAFMLYGVIVAVSFSFVASSFSELAQAAGAVERVLDITDGTDQQAIAVGTQVPERTEGAIEFRSVSFAYPSRPEERVLHSVSFSLEPGTTTAVVGPSGAGKTTIASLLLALYQPTDGTILFDGIALSELDPEWFHSRVALVPQDPALFALSILDNVRYARPEATENEVLAVCKQARVMEFAENLPQGLHTVCGERGHQLSGGQRQRVAIARALLREPVLLVLDEATSALDSSNEELVQSALSEVLTASTSLVIAHRLSTIRDSDQVIVVDGGRIQQVGTHETLSKTDGLYAELLVRQLLAAPQSSVAQSG